MPKLKRGRKPVGRQRKKTSKSAETSKQNIASTLVSSGPDSLTVLATQQLQCDFIGDFVDCCCILHSVEPQPTSINKHFPGEGDERYLNVGCNASKLRRLYLNDPEEEDDDVPGEADEHYFIVGCTAQKYDPEEDVDVLKAQHLKATFNSLRYDIEQRKHELIKSTSVSWNALKTYTSANFMNVELKYWLNFLSPSMPNSSHTFVSMENSCQGVIIFF